MAKTVYPEVVSAHFKFQISSKFFA